ncbi:hypothetical protein C8F04DRAFT_1273375 [Mycena alexandri]|uniref:Uncharacterized protein n=1 Tax=Mycena alexandri TaxID=1745969 RepID=A0AAD6WQV0_9AGAR|nr:hypothetical protein C8F04DRAFT_1273375 [Mycena alexandri]
MHSGMSNGLMPRIWSDFDRGGFDFAQRSLVDFTHHCFTNEECRARVVKTTPAESDADDVIDETGPATDIDDDAVGVRPALTKEVRPEGAMTKGTEFTLTPDELAMYLPQGLTGAELNASEGLSAEEIERMLFDPSAFNPDGSLRNGLGQSEGMFGEDGGEASFGLDSSLWEGAQIPRPVLREDPHMPTPGGQQPLVIREVLRAEMELMGLAAAKYYATSLQAMSIQAVEWENELADKRAAAVAHSPPPPRPEPKPAGRAAELQRPEVNGDAEGPLNVDVVVPGRTGGKSKSAQKGAEKTNKEGGEEKGGGEEEGPEWVVQDMSGWSEELQKAYAAFGRAKEFGGDEWVACVEQLLALERAREFRAKGLLAVPNGGPKERPREVPEWMQARRRSDKGVELTSTIGPAQKKGSFSARWWDWWALAQPASRVQANGKFKLAERVPVGEWEDMSKMVGRNGLLLYLGGLLWWGEAAAGDEESEVLLRDWSIAVDDVTYALKMAVSCVGGESNKKSEAVKGKRKRATEVAAAEEEKENAPPKKRRKRTKA